MKKSILVLAIIFLAGTLTSTYAFDPTGDINVKTKVFRLKDDKNTPEDESQFCQLEFSSDCKDCGKIFIRIDGKYAGQIDIKYRNVTILVKKPGVYKYTATTAAGQQIEGEVVAP